MLATGSATLQMALPTSMAVSHSGGFWEVLESRSGAHIAWHPHLAHATDAWLDAYIEQAMQRATFELLLNEGVYGEIPGIQGAYSLADTEEESRRELADVLRSWLIFSQQRGLAIPMIDELG